MDLRKLLLKDLSARLPYGVKCEIDDIDEPLELESIKFKGDYFIFGNGVYERYITEIKPYLRPMASMTEEEEIELTKITSQLTFDRRYNLLYVGRADDGGCDLSEMEKIVDYLISHHFDFRGLISLGLALEAHEGMYGI